MALSLAKDCNAALAYLDAPFGQDDKRPSALLRSLALARASPALAHLASHLVKIGIFLCMPCCQHLSCHGRDDKSPTAAGGTMPRLACGKQGSCAMHKQRTDLIPELTTQHEKACIKCAFKLNDQGIMAVSPISLDCLVTQSEAKVSVASQNTLSN